jgi:hypothetical protein
VVIDSGLTVSDVDDANLSGATISISANYVGGEDVLSFTDTASITGSWNAAIGVLTLSGTDSIANYESALRSIAYRNTSENPSAVSRTIAFFVDDASDTSAGSMRNIAITAVNDAPVITSSGVPMTYTENDPATPIDPGLTISDVDNADLFGATVRISGGFVPGEDVLAFSDQLGITGSFNAASGVLTLGGIAPVPDYEAALRSVAYFNTSDNPNVAPRTIAFEVDDGFDKSSAAATVNLVPVNDAPLAAADSYAVDEDGMLSVSASGVLGNDSDPDGPPLTAVLISGPANAALVLAADGSFVYAPRTDFNGIDSFTYRATDGAMSSNVVTVTITVNPINDAPVAVADGYTVDNNAVLTVAASGVLLNDRDVDNNPLAAVLVGSAANGTVALNSDGSFTYLPNPNFAGTDSFTYRARDGSLDSNITTVTITVNAVAGPRTDNPPDDDGDALPQQRGPLPVAGPMEDRDEDLFERNQRNPSERKEATGRSIVARDIAFRHTLFSEIRTAHSNWIAGDVDTEIAALEDGYVFQNVPGNRLAELPRRITARLEMETISEVGLLWGKLDRMQDEMKLDLFERTLIVGVATTLTATLSVGYLLWTLRGGYLVASMLSTMPAWRWIDPLPILDGYDNSRRDKQGAEADEESLESLVTYQHAQSPSGTVSLES